jgi:predicted dehydrogenase
MARTSSQSPPRSRNYTPAGVDCRHGSYPADDRRYPPEISRNICYQRAIENNGLAKARRNEGIILPIRKIIIVGLGNAGLEHAKALESIPDVEIVAGVDINSSRKLTFKGSEVPVYARTFELTDKIEPDIVVVATPTSSHANVCEEVSGYFRTAAILVEKPAADSLDNALRIIEGVSSKQKVHIAYHMTFSPEVRWALRWTQDRAGQLGPPVAVEAWSVDPYQALLDSARARLGSSWIDSGINALSVIENFARLIECTSIRALAPADESAFEGRFICESEGNILPATVLTSWHSTSPARSTRIRYSCGAEVTMDHHAVAAYVLENGRILDIFGSDGATPRREAHYKCLYHSWLVEGHPISSSSISLRLHRLLYEKFDGLGP